VESWEVTTTIVWQLVEPVLTTEISTALIFIQNHSGWINGHPHTFRRSQRAGGRQSTGM